MTTVQGRRPETPSMVPTDSELYGTIITGLHDVLAGGSDYEFDPALVVRRSLFAMVGSGDQLNDFQTTLLIEHPDEVIAGGAWGELSGIVQSMVEQAQVTV